ncbi:MAG: TolC family protein [Candidatus Eremiobacteraeota bacterium]|nr:TolC family protein [Candidatus Eremiobacteraeota bacterium]
MSRRFLAIAQLAVLIAGSALPAAAQNSPQPMVTTQPAPIAAPTAIPQMSAAPQATAMPSSVNRTNGLPPPPQPQDGSLAPVPNVAPGYTAPDIGVPNGNIVGVTQQPFVGITLQNAVAMALMKNTDLAIAQANRRIAGYQIEAAKGAYDVRFNVQPSYSHTTTPPQNAFFSGPGFGPIVQDQTNISAGLSGMTTSGQQYSVSASDGRVLNNSIINTFNPTYPASLSFNLSQPLLRGRSINEASRQLQLATINQQTVSAQSLTSASQTVTQVEDAYWDLVAAWRNVAIQEEALREAKRQSQSNARLARQGYSAPIDVVQSNTQVNVFQDNVFSALQNVQRLQVQLKSLIVADPGDPIWNANLVPTSPVQNLPPEPQLGSVVAQAIANRPEFEQLRGARNAAGVNLAYAKDQLKPQVDFNVGYTTSGFAGNLLPAPTGGPFAGNPLPPAYLAGGNGQSVSNLVTNKFPSYNAAVNVQLPLGNHTAKANYAIAKEQLRETDLNQISLLQRINSESRNALQAYRAARYRLIAARAARAASEQVLASEIRRFHAGASTTFLVLQRQVDLANNRGRELQAQTDLNKAVVELERVTGSILKDNNVDATTLGQGTLQP